MFQKNKLVLGVTSAVALMMSISSYAEKDSQVLAIDIASQRADQALLELALDAGVQIMMPTELSGNIKLPALKGNYTLTQALQKILKDSGLTYHFTAENSLIIDKEKSEKEDDQEAVEEIVVTGSSLKKRDLSAPLDVFTREDLARRGIFSAEEFVRSLSANFSNVNESTTTNHRPDDDLVVQRAMTWSGLEGSSAANLRGLGINGTLVLINGRRVARSPVLDNGFVDLNGISFEEIERVEVLYDGASAKYGSDAISGVINFILRRDGGVGATTNIRHNHGQHGGNTFTLSQSFRYQWGSGRVRASINKSETKAVSSAKAGWTTKDLTSQGGTDHRSNTAQPGAVYEGFDRSTWTFRYSALPEGHDGVGATESDFSSTNLTKSDWDLNQDLTTGREVTTIRLDAEQDLDFMNATLWLDASHTKNETNNRSQTEKLDRYPVPASNAFNPFGEEVRVSYVFQHETDMGLIEQTKPINENENIRLNSGLKIDLPFDSWTLDVSGRFSEHSVKALYSGINIHLCDRDPVTGRPKGLFFHRTDPTLPGRPEFDGPNGFTNFQCLPGQESSFRRLLASSDPAEAINLFGNGSAQSPVLSDALLTYSDGAPATHSYGYEAAAEGEMFQLPGGGVRVAVGYSHGVQVTDYSKDRNRIGFVRDNEKVRTIRDGLYIETSIPVFGGDFTIPFVKHLEIGLQNRWSRLEMPESEAARSVFTKGTPKFTLAWRPIDDLLLRGTWSKSFRAPSNTEITGTGGRYDDPALCVEGEGSGENGACFYPWDDHGFSVRYTDVDGYYDDDGTFIEGPAPVRIYTTRQGVNPNIRPEQGENITFGFDWTPEFLPGFKLRATASRVDYTDKIEQVSHHQWEPAEWQSIPDLFWEDPETDRLRLVRSVSANIAVFRNESVDFDATYDFETDYGSFLVGVNGTRTLALDRSLILGGQTNNIAGTLYGSDDLVGRGFVSWSQDRLGLTLSANYKSDYTHKYFDRDPDTGRLVRLEKSVDSYWTMDLTGSYRTLDSGWTANFGILDLTNNHYPFINGPGGAPFDNRRVNIKGRTAYLSLTKSFEFD